MLLCPAFVWRCASIAAPQGGPKDSLPPVAVSAQPAFNTLNFDAKRIYIGFDEYVKVQDQQKEVFTSPKMKTPPTIMVRGRGVQIDIKDTLQENTTYAVNFGSAIRDNNEGNPLYGFRYVFSTGPEIDSMLMSGYTDDAYTRDTVSKTFIYFFDPAADSMPYDSTLLRSSPLAVARAETNGIFIAQNLKPIPYRVYAFEDGNGNQQYDPGADKVAFLDSVYNPLGMPDFSVWYDTTRNCLTADPQLYFRMFTDKQFRRQYLAESARPDRYKLVLNFNAPNPRIDSLAFEGLDSADIVTEYPTPGRDTIFLWLHKPAEELPDTIKGGIKYWKHDSLNVLQPVTENLKLFWKYIETKEERRERERREKERAETDSAEYVEPPKPNPFKFGSTAQGEVNPEEKVSLTFDYPLVEADTAAVRLIRVAEDEKQYLVRQAFVRDTADLHRWFVDAALMPKQKYRLEIPAGALTNVAGESNDSIKAEFSTLDPEKFGTFVANVRGKSDTARYILEVLDENGKLLRQRRDAVTGSYRFDYLPAGNIRLRIVEDVNGNGAWDTGDMIARRQPERVEMYVSPSGDELFAMKANWEIEETVDMGRVFAPVTVETVRERVRAMEAARAKKLAEERAKRAETQNNDFNRGGMTPTYDGGGMNPGGFGGIGGIGGAQPTMRPGGY